MIVFVPCFIFFFSQNKGKIQVIFSNSSMFYNNQPLISSVLPLHSEKSTFMFIFSFICFTTQLIPVISSLTPLTTVIPLVAVLCFIAFKDGVDDYVSQQLSFKHGWRKGITVSGKGVSRICITVWCPYSSTILKSILCLFLQDFVIPLSHQTHSHSVRKIFVKRT